jgi:outer membrane biosynthesis protein TonB
MKKVLHFNQGPFAGRDVEVDEDETVIQNYLDTGYCSEAEVKEPEPAPKRAEPREVAAEVAPQPEAEVKEEKPKKPRKKRVRRKRETPEG